MIWETCKILIPILTISDGEVHIVKSYQLQATCYHTKPGQLDVFESLVKSTHDFWLIKVHLPQQRQADEQEIDQSTALSRR